MIKKKFLPLQSPNERGLSSVGLERLLDRQEVGSSNLPVLTTRKRHLQRCRCLFFYSGQSPRFRQTAAHKSSLYVSTTGFVVRRGPKSACGAPQSPAQRAEPASRCGYLAAVGVGGLRAGDWRYHRISTRMPSGLLGKRRKRVREAGSQEQSAAALPSTRTLPGSRGRRIRVTLKVSAGALHR